MNKEKPKSAKNRKKESTKPYGALGRERRLVLFTSPFPHPAFLESVIGHDNANHIKYLDCFH